MRYEAAWLVAAVAGICVLAADVGLRVEPWATSGTHRSEHQELGGPKGRQAGAANDQGNAANRAGLLDHGNAEPEQHAGGAEQRYAGPQPGVVHDVEHHDESWFVHWGGLLASWATVFIVPLTVWLACVGYRQARSGEIAAQASVVSANAARDSAKAASETAGLLVAQEAPLIAFRFDWQMAHTRLDYYSGVLRPRTEYYINFVNYGRTAATTLYFQAEVKLGGSQYVDTSTKMYYDENIIEPMLATPPVLLKLEPELTEQDLLAIQSGQAVLRVAAAIRYRDVFGQVHDRRFGLVFDTQMNRYRADTAEGLDG